jgi:MFS family permease
MKRQDTFSSLTKTQKEAIGLLSIGTFLEYFDLMLYVHMAVLLNELFFSEAATHTAALLSAFAFCSTFVFRPIGALIFGWLGDNIGRKAAVVITTFLMSISCVIMATLPTYAQIGITASWAITICRVIQGISSMGEIIGAELYLTETIKPPIQYSAIALIGTLSAFGGMFALGIASLVTAYGFNWRNAFWIGAGVAVIGSVARTALRETPDFVDAKRRMIKTFGEVNKDPKVLEKNYIVSQKVSRKTALAYFLIECAWPVSFYFVYIHCGNILKNSFNYTAEQVIHHNFIVSIVHLLSTVLLIFLSYKIYPLKIVKFRLAVFFGSILFYPYLLNHISTPFYLILLQSFFFLFRTDTFPALPIFYKYFPIFKRFTYISLLFAFSRALMHIVTFFGLVYLIEYLGNWGLLIIMIPVSMGFAFGILHFETLEKEAGNYPEKNSSEKLMDLAPGLMSK